MERLCSTGCLDASPSSSLSSLSSLSSSPFRIFDSCVRRATVSVLLPGASACEPETMYMACGNWMRDSPSSSRMMSKLRGRAGGVRAAPRRRGRAQQRSRHNAARASGTATPAETSAGSRRRWDHSPALRLRRAHPLPGAKPAALHSAAASQGAARRVTPGATHLLPVCVHRRAVYLVALLVVAAALKLLLFAALLHLLLAGTRRPLGSARCCKHGAKAPPARATHDRPPHGVRTSSICAAFCCSVFGLRPMVLAACCRRPTAAACTRPGRRATLWRADTSRALFLWEKRGKERRAGEGSPATNDAGVRRILLFLRPSGIRRSWLKRLHARSVERRATHGATTTRELTTC